MLSSSPAAVVGPESLRKAVESLVVVIAVAVAVVVTAGAALAVSETSLIDATCTSGRGGSGEGDVLMAEVDSEVTPATEGSEMAGGP